jgi:hypothetical protein
MIPDARCLYQQLAGWHYYNSELVKLTLTNYLRQESCVNERINQTLFPEA